MRAMTFISVLFQVPKRTAVRICLSSSHRCLPPEAGGLAVLLQAAGNVVSPGHGDRRKGELRIRRCPKACPSSPGAANVLVGRCTSLTTLDPPTQKWRPVRSLCDSRPRLDALQTRPFRCLSMCSKRSTGVTQHTVTPVQHQEPWITD